MVEIKTAGEIDAIRASGQVVAGVLAAARSCAAPGVTLAELDRPPGRCSPRRGDLAVPELPPAFAPFPYPAVICTSVNDAALHGIPGDYRLQEVNLLSVDAGATLDGWVGDAAISFTVGARLTGRRADRGDGGGARGRDRGGGARRQARRHLGRDR